MFYGLGKVGLSNKLSVLEFFEVFKVGLFLIARIKQPMIQKRRHKYPNKMVIERAAVFTSSNSLSSDSLPSFLSSLSCVIAPSTSYMFLLASTEAIMADAKDIIL